MKNAISVMEKATVAVEGQILKLRLPSGDTESCESELARVSAADSLGAAAEYLRLANVYREAGQIEEAQINERFVRDELASFAALMGYALGISQ